MKGCPGLSTPVWMAWSSVKPLGVATPTSRAYMPGVRLLAMQLLCFRRSGYSALHGHTRPGSDQVPMATEPHPPPTTETMYSTTADHRGR